MPTLLETLERPAKQAKLTDEQLRLELFNAHHLAGCGNCNCAWDAVVRRVHELKEQL